MVKAPFGFRRLMAMPPARAVRALVLRLAPSGRGGSEARSPAAPHPFDLIYGADTTSPLTGPALRTGAAADVYNVGYFPSQPSVARAAIAALPPLEGAAFIDFGCGRGRVLAVAAEGGFATIVGLELSPVLAEDARTLALGLRRLRPDLAAITVVEGDGLAYTLPQGPIVMYLYNSAFAGVLRPLAERLVRHQAAAEANKAFLIYVNPANARVFDKTRGLRRYYASREALDADDRASSPFGGTEESVVIWQTVSAVMHPAHPGADRKVRIAGWGDVGLVQI